MRPAKLLKHMVSYCIVLTFDGNLEIGAHVSRGGFRNLARGGGENLETKILSIFRNKKIENRC